MDAKTKRERIILIVLAIVVLYGIYSLLLAPGKKNKATDTKVMASELQEFVAQTTEGISRDLPSSFDAYLISRAESRWERNPFNWKPPVKSEVVSAKPFFIYTGYVETADGSVAVINNMEYRNGDQLEKEGFFLKKISPSSVIISNKNEKTELNVKLSE